MLTNKNVQDLHAQSLFFNLDVNGANQTDAQQPSYKPPPKNLICPEPLEDNLTGKKERSSGSSFNPLLHQPRRDMYGRDLKKGIPPGFQHILYEISNAVIQSSNYNDPNPDTKKVFANKTEIYRFIADHLEMKLIQRATSDPEAKLGKVYYGTNVNTLNSIKMFINS